MALTRMLAPRACCGQRRRGAANLGGALGAHANGGWHGKRCLAELQTRHAMS